MSLEEMIENIPASVRTVGFGVEDIATMESDLASRLYLFARKTNDAQSYQCSDNYYTFEITPTSITRKKVTTFHATIEHYEYYDGKVDSFYCYFHEWTGGIITLKIECSFDKVMMMVTTSEGDQYWMSFSSNPEEPCIFLLSFVSKECLREISLEYDFAHRLTLSSLCQTFRETMKSETHSNLVSLDNPEEIIAAMINHPELDSVITYFSNLLSGKYMLDKELFKDFSSKIMEFMTILMEKVSPTVDMEEEIAPILKYAIIPPIDDRVIQADTDSDLPF